MERIDRIAASLGTTEQDHDKMAAERGAVRALADLELMLVGGGDTPLDWGGGG